MAITQEQWDALPDNIKREIQAYANTAQQAQQRLQQWDAWAEPNREYLSRWPETVQRLREAQDREDSEELTFEETQKRLRQTQREAQEHRRYIQDLSLQLGATRQQLENLAGRQQSTVSLSAQLAKWQSEDPQRRDARELVRLASERGINDWETATRTYDEEQSKRQPAGTQRAMRFVRPGADDNRQHRLNRDTQVADEVMRVLNAGGDQQAQSPIEMVWRKGRRPGNPIPEMNEGR